MAALRILPPVRLEYFITLASFFGKILDEYWKKKSQWGGRIDFSAPL